LPTSLVLAHIASVSTAKSCTCFDPKLTAGRRMASKAEADVGSQENGALRILWRSPASVTLQRSSRASLGSMQQHRDGTASCLRPTHALLCSALEKRTAVTTSADLACALSSLELSPGDHVIDAGTGSGAAACAFARTVGPSGSVVSCEYHEHRSSAALHDLPRIVGNHLSIHHRDVLSDGFPVPHGHADAAFIDLPSPEHAVVHVHAALREGGCVGFLTPCIEQAQAVASALRLHGFAWVQTEERVLRELAVSESSDDSSDCSGAFGIPQSERDSRAGSFRTRPAGKARGHTAYLTFARKAVDETPSDDLSPSATPDSGER